MELKLILNLGQNGQAQIAPGLKKQGLRVSINKTISIISLSICKKSFTHLYHELS
jgi:hypothetical protein